MNEPRAAAPEDSDGAARRPGFHWMDAVMLLNVMGIALLFIPQILAAFDVIGGGEPPGGAVRASDLYINSGIILVMLGVVPFLWIALTRVGGWQGTIDYFALRRPAWGIAWGTGLAIALLILIVIIGLILQLAGGETDNPAVADLQGILTWPLVVFVAFSAAFGEEILFRGILQKRIGMWGQAVVFGALHAYQGVYGIVLTFLLGVLFGYIVRRRLGLWIPLAAHFMFDFIQLSLLMLVEAP